MLEKFLQLIKEEKLFSSGNKILLAVSGGVDSVVMCELFQRAGFKFGVAHCNFKLRSKEADMDEKFVQVLAEKFKVKLHTKDFATARYADKHKISIQMAARELRYSFFEEVRAKFGYDFIATAHHRTDVMETMLLNLTRGTGISGLHGILPKRGKIIRPLLFAKREEIEAFASENKISFREDSSNRSEKYQRNLIRKKIIPVLKEINPGVENSFYQTASRLRGVEKMYLDFVDAFRKTNLISEKDKTMIPIRGVTSFDYGEAILFELLRPFGFSSEVVTKIIQSADSTPGKQFLSESHCLTRDRKYFIVTPVHPQLSLKEITIEKVPAEINFNDEELKFTIEDAEEFSVPATSEVSCLDLDKLIFPLVLRGWKEGDRFQPLGMKTQKKISDFLVGIKMPLNEKHNLSVLVNADEIICIPCIRINEKYKVAEETKKIIVIRKN